MNVVQPDYNEEQPHISSLETIPNLDAHVTPLSPQFSCAVVAVKISPMMDSSKKSSLHLLKNAEVYNLNDSEASLTETSTSNGGMSPMSSPGSVYGIFGQNCWSAERNCPLPSTSESSSQSPIVHPDKLYKYSKDGEYQANLAVVHSKINIDLHPTPTGTNEKRLLSTMSVQDYLWMKLSKTKKGYL